MTERAPKPATAHGTTDTDTDGAPAGVRPADEVVELCRDLIRIDSTNFGDNKGPGEREAADYVVQRLREVGLDPVTVGREDRRPNVMVRIEGEDTSRGGLVVHGHLDVVPAAKEDWSVDPFAAEVKDGMIWGRGAVDMKDMDAMILASIRDLARTGTKPARTTTFVFFADEEAGGRWGSQWVVDTHPEWFEGATEAISEVGGYSITLPKRDGGDQRAYLVQTAEKGIAWVHLKAKGRAGHGSVPNDDNAIVHLAGAIDRIAAHKWDGQLITSVRELREGVEQITGKSFSDEDPQAFLDAVGGARDFVAGTLRDTANFTMLESGYKHNVVPQSAQASLDCRFLPGHEEQVLATLRELAGDDVEVVVDIRSDALEASFDTPLVAAMRESLLEHDPGSTVLPYCLSGGTDNKALGDLGITGYGFAPLRLPADLAFAPMFHGVDERVPVDAVTFGATVLRRFLDLA